MNKTKGNFFLNAPYILWAVLFIIVPMLFVAYYTFTNASGEFTFNNIVTFFTSKAYMTVFGRSMLYAFWATLICLVLGFLFIGFGTISYFASDATGDVVLKSGVIELNVTGYDEITKSYTLKEDGDVMPGDSGEFTISIDVANSTSDVYCYLTFDKEVVPSNLNFYFSQGLFLFVHCYINIVHKHFLHSNNLEKGYG